MRPEDHGRHHAARPARLNPMAQRGLRADIMAKAAEYQQARPSDSGQAITKRMALVPHALERVELAGRGGIQGGWKSTQLVWRRVCYLVVEGQGKVGVGVRQCR